jgi:hypothetical protein
MRPARLGQAVVDFMHVHCTAAATTNNMPQDSSSNNNNNNNNNSNNNKTEESEKRLLQLVQSTQTHLQPFLELTDPKDFLHSKPKFSPRAKCTVDFSDGTRPLAHSNLQRGPNLQDDCHQVQIARRHSNGCVCVCCWRQFQFQFQFQATSRRNSQRRQRRRIFSAIFSTASLHDANQSTNL